MKQTFTTLTCLCLTTLLPGMSPAQGFGPRTPEQDSLMARQQRKTQADHRLMLAALHIGSLRPGPSGNPKAPNAANTDEAKATTYTTLPDPLKLASGKSVTSAKQWWSTRRPELIEAFDREVYGRMPANTPGVRWEVVSQKDTVEGSYLIRLKRLAGHVDNSTYPTLTVNIDLVLTTPVAATGPVPVMLEFGFRFPPGFRMPQPPTSTTAPAPPSWQQQLLAKGWG